MQPPEPAPKRTGPRPTARRIVAHAFMTLDGVLVAPEERQREPDGERLTLLRDDDGPADPPLAAGGAVPTTARTDDTMAQLAALKRQPGRDIVVTGGDTAIRALLQAGLVDDLHLRVHPLVAGHGPHLFPDTGSRIPLTLVAASASPTGVLHLRYRPD
ncbi:dihydrofolate reductase family protein [Streptomyces sp. AC536]|uniref:dihydrofolate reductase family protein n=1 Tax=Streptomyces buecherae TaxID=2763006 RepID=UPI00164D1C8C|nr:dihydrofolate reductase family protein [Streptomyces buecherae]MBC3981320.1 dihydrofolate reductase family protein [Streptomyces buecherae]QNJ40918.1 dihydrofolate reductase family protein [Streptomyces buecherae]